MAWQRGTEAPMDTSPAGPRKRSIFETQSDNSPFAFASSSTMQLDPPAPPSYHSNAPFLFHCKPSPQVQDALADVEMASVTPPSHRNSDRSAVDSQAQRASPWVDDDDDNQANAADDPSPSKKPQRPISSAAVNRVRRRRSLQAKPSRRRNGQLALARRSARDFDAEASSDGEHRPVGEDHDDDDDDDDDDEEDDDDENRTPGEKMRSITKYAVNYFLPSSLDAVHPPSLKSGAPPGVDHLDWPELLLGYAQFVFNASILAAFLYLLFCVVRTVQQDVAEKVRGYEMDTLSEITSCAASYSANRCGTDLQAPALAAACLNWERCSARDPAVVGRARVTAETFAEILNGFVDAVSWKSMLFSLLTLSIVVGATNSTLSFFRIRSRKQHQLQQQQHHQHHQQHQQQQPQQHPQHAIGGVGDPGAGPYSYATHPAFYPHPPHPAAGPWTLASQPATPARKRIHRSAQ